MTTPTTSGERPVVLRGALLLFGLVIIAISVQQWSAIPADADPGIGFYLLPLVLASSLIVQFFAKTRNSPLMLASVILVVATLVLFWLVSSGRV